MNKEKNDLCFALWKTEIEAKIEELEKCEGKEGFARYATVTL